MLYAFVLLKTSLSYSCSNKILVLTLNISLASFFLLQQTHDSHLVIKIGCDI